MARFLTDCSVCLEYITGPQKLPCDHTFCSNCVNRLRRGDIIKCPTCNKFHEFRLVRHDFKHAQFLEALETERKLSERRRMRKDVAGFLSVLVPIVDVEKATLVAVTSAFVD